MNKLKSTAVIYSTKNLSTKRYAGWLAIKLDADLYEISDITINALKKYKTIIYGGNIVFGKIKNIKFIVDNIDKIKDKKIIIFGVGILEENLDLVEYIKQENLLVDKDIYEDIKMFYIQGNFEYEKLDLLDKIIIKNKIRHKEYRGKNISKYDEEFIKNIDETIENTHKSNIEKILTYLEYENELISINN